LADWLSVHVRRGANSVANELAKAAVKQVIDRIWMKEILRCAYDIVLLEQHAIFI
jgi:hypothetical protein